jgi:lipoprotein signal peptidase
LSIVDPRYRAFAVLGALCFGLDRFSKSWVESSLELGERVAAIEGFLYLTYVRNAGGAFGLFSDAPLEWKAIAFGTAAALALAVVISLLRSLTPRDVQLGAALGLVAGGALANVYDRIPPFGNGEVIDLLHVNLWSGYPWPDFNVADATIVVGVASLVIDMLARESAARAADEGAEPIDVDETRA